MTTSMAAHRLWSIVFAVVGSLVMSSVFAATRTVELGTVEVASPAPEAYREAMRVVLVRLSGRRSAATDPALQRLLDEAERYVQIFRPATAGAPAQVTLDDLAIERALDALGEPVWPRERALVLGVILSAPPGADPAQVRAALTRAAEERGLPLQLSPASAVGLTPGGRADAGAAMAAARRLGASAGLIAEAQGDRWVWTLFQPAGSASATRFEGDATAGVEGAADTLALGSQELSAQPVSEVELRVTGITDLLTHGAAQRSLAGLPVVEQLELLQVSSQEVRVRLRVSGGVRGLETSLDADPLWQRERDAADLLYRFVGSAAVREP